MGKHLNYKTKYNYVMRYRNGESPSKLGYECIQREIVNINSSKPADIIMRWNKQYENNGIDGLMSKTGLNATGRKPKEKPSEQTKDEFKNWTKEELERLIEIYREIDRDISKKESYSYIKKEKIISTSKMCQFFKVSRSGYYNWLKNGSLIHGKYDEKLLEQIKFLFYLKNERFGFRRIHILLQKEFNIFVNVNTVNRYMKFLNLRAKIRVKKRKQEIKITDRGFKDLIKRDFKANKQFQKLYTDVSYIKITDGWAYLSAVIDGYNNEIVGWTFSKRNNNEFVFKSIKKALDKATNHKELIIHSDHGYQYFSTELQKLKEELNFKQSMGRIGVSLDNRPIEYFFSVLKQEYLFGKSLSFEKTFEKLRNSIYDYNNKRFQSGIKNMTPREFAMSY